MNEKTWSWGGAVLPLDVRNIGLMARVQQAGENLRKTAAALPKGGTAAENMRRNYDMFSAFFKTVFGDAAGALLSDPDDFGGLEDAYFDLMETLYSRIEETARRRAALAEKYSPERLRS